MPVLAKITSCIENIKIFILSQLATSAFCVKENSPEELSELNEWMNELIFLANQRFVRQLLRESFVRLYSIIPQHLTSFRFLNFHLGVKTIFPEICPVLFLPCKVCLKKSLNLIVNGGSQKIKTLKWVRYSLQRSLLLINDLPKSFSVNVSLIFLFVEMWWWINSLKWILLDSKCNLISRDSTAYFRD